MHFIHENELQKSSDLHVDDEGYAKKGKDVDRDGENKLWTYIEINYENSLIWCWWWREKIESRLFAGRRWRLNQ